MSQSENKLIKELRKEITKLKRELSQANKKNRRLSNEITNYEYDHDDFFEEETKESPSFCPKCKKHDTGVINVGVYSVFICNDCGHRSRQTIKD